ASGPKRGHMHLRGTFGSMVFSRIGSTPTQATSSWLSFLAPIGVTMLIIVPVSAALLSSGVEPVDRDETESSVDFGQDEFAERDLPSREPGDFTAAVPDTLPKPPNRRRGFSPVVRGDEELGSWGEDDDYDDDDEDDEDLEDVSREDESPEEKEARKERIAKHLARIEELTPEVA